MDLYRAEVGASEIFGRLCKKSASYYVHRPMRAAHRFGAGAAPRLENSSGRELCLPSPASRRVLRHILVRLTDEACFDGNFEFLNVKAMGGGRKKATGINLCKQLGLS